MRVCTLIVLTFFQIQLFGQVFSAELFFEDSLGRMDTLTVGYDVFATSDIDGEFGELDILGTETSEFDVRFFTYENAFEEDLPFTCAHENFDLPFLFEDIALHESKVSITPSGCSIGDQIFTISSFTIPFDAAFPITIRWDNSPFVKDYGCGAFVSWISELSRGEFIQDDWCPERINYDSISLTSLDSIVLETPNFKTISKMDSSLLSVYYIYLTDFGNIGQVSTRELFDSGLKIQPNPVTDRLYLETTDQNWSYQVLNLQGQQMMNGQYQDHIEMHQLPSGIYFLQLQKEDELYQAIKFVKE